MAVAVYYVVLGVDQCASDDDIHRAYQRHALAYWSSRDRNTTLAARRFRAVEEAYSVLGDPIRRAAYDAQITRRLYRPARSTGVVSPAIGAPAAAPAPAPIELPPMDEPVTPVATGSVFIRVRPSIIGAVLVGLLLIGVAGGPQRATMSRIIGMMGGRLPAPTRAQPHGGTPATANPLIVSELVPGPTARRMIQSSASRAVLLTTSAPPAAGRAARGTAPPDAAMGMLPWKPARQVTVGAAPGTPEHGNSPDRATRNALPGHSPVQPRAAWLRPGDDALPASPPRPSTGGHGRARVAPLSGTREEHGAWPAIQWRRFIRHGSVRRRPRIAAGPEIGRYGFRHAR